ncbi:radial spoke head 10 homolog B [Echeneis naucrates]|uniref:radial spoke head 10 homolog B n=1 Tax=Echeneis naucrates TaxID=173247 RepID=UPI00111351BE|nr:radial spoke head 10 homolog B [Echeneis naucrates]
MTKGRDEKKTATTGDKQENEGKRGKTKRPQIAEEKEGKFWSYSGGSKENLTELNQRPEIDDLLQLPALFSLTVHRYEGETWEGQRHGEGLACFEGGQMYKGMFKKGLMDGVGVFTWSGGIKYEGEFVCNMPMGQGKYTWPNGSSYVGEVYNGVRHGTGSFKDGINGVSYRGQWDQGKRHGKGTVYYSHDKTSWYKGDWVKNNREGMGVRCYPSGNIYSGEWKNNLRHGEGTMKWLKQGQEYVGMWQDGVQHGQGTHTWILRRVDGSQYLQSNQYTGDFVHGQRHGQGTFHYAGGAIYKGGWKNNKKHGKGKFTFKDGHVFEGEFVDDQMMAPNLHGNRAPTPLCGAFPRSGSDSSFSGPDRALNIECLLDKIPQRKWDSERKQVGFVLLRNDTELRSIYSFYSRLGHSHSPDNTFLLSRLQLWCLLKDCNISHHDITLTQIDRFIKDDTSAVIHCPFTPMKFHGFLSCLVIVAYHIYKKHMVEQKYLLAACLSKLLTNDILPNATNVKGFLFGQSGLSVVALKNTQRCWEVYQTFCSVLARDDQTMTCRHLLWMFKDLRLLDDQLTTARLLKIIKADSRDPDNLSSCLDLEITFLEFFDVLLGCAEVKSQCGSETVMEHQNLSRSNADTRRDLPENKSEDQRDVKTEVNEQPHPTEHTGEDRREDMMTRRTEAKSQTLDEFFNHFFFPAFEHHQLVTRNMKSHIAVAKAQ